LIFGYGRSVNSSRLLGFWPELWRVLRLI
jgi:hypothetical protein